MSEDKYAHLKGTKKTPSQSLAGKISVKPLTEEQVTKIKNLIQTSEDGMRNDVAKRYWGMLSDVFNEEIKYPIRDVLGELVGESKECTDYPKWEGWYYGGAYLAISPSEEIKVFSNYEWNNEAEEKVVSAFSEENRGRLVLQAAKIDYQLRRFWEELSSKEDVLKEFDSFKKDFEIYTDSYAKKQVPQSKAFLSAGAEEGKVSTTPTTGSPKTPDNG